MATNMQINTGAPRNITGHTISGALASGALAGAINYNKYIKGEMGKTEAINDSLKLTAQGGIATGSAIAAANYIGNGNMLGFLSAMSLGVAGVYAAEKFSEKINETIQIEHQSTEQIEKEEE